MTYAYFDKQENVDRIKRYKEILDRGNYANSKDTVDAYNECFASTKPRQSYTNCGSCLRRCILALWDALQEHLNSNVAEGQLLASEGTNEEHMAEKATEGVKEPTEPLEETKAEDTVTEANSKPSKRQRKKID